MVASQSASITLDREGESADLACRPRGGPSSMKLVLMGWGACCVALVLYPPSAQGQVTGTPSDAQKLEQLKEQTQKALANALKQGNLTSEQIKQYEQMRRLRALQSRGGRGPQSGAPIILNGGPPVGPAVAPTATSGSESSAAKKSAKDKRTEARRNVEERRRKAQAEAERKKAQRKAAAEAAKLKDQEVRAAVKDEAERK